MEKTREGHLVPDRVRALLAGIASGVSKIVVGHPFDTLKVRLQHEGHYGRFKGPLDCLWQTYKFEGFRALYKGASLPLLTQSFIDLVMVGTYSELRRYCQLNLVEDPSQPLAYKWIMLCGFGGGVACSFVVTPVEQIKARLQVQYHNKVDQQYKGPLDCAKQLYKNNGFFGFYKGYAATFAYRSLISVYFSAYEFFKRYFDSMQQLHGAVKTFLAGGCAATINWLISLPTDTVKNKMMAQKDSVDRPYKTLRDCVRITYQREGFIGFYQGLVPCMLRAFPANGMAFLAIEFTMKYLP